MSEILKTINELHECYKQETGYPLFLNLGRERDWLDWIRYSTPPWTEADLKLVIYHVKKRHEEMNKKGPAPRLKFRSLIGDTEWFEEALAEARAQWKNRMVKTAKQDILAATGRDGSHKDNTGSASKAPPPTEKTPADVLDKGWEAVRAAARKK